MVRLETLIELVKFELFELNLFNSSCPSLSSCRS